jgi:hypothetical protein
MNLYILAAPAAVDPHGFDTLPTPLYIIVVCWVILIFLRRYGKRITPDSGKTYDTVIDALSLISASGVILAFASTPLGSNGLTWLGSFVPSADTSLSFSGTKIGIMVIALVALGGLAWLYTRSEGLWPLIAFSVALYLAGGLNPYIRTGLEWVVDPGMQSISNFIVGIASSIFNAAPFKT